MEFSAVIMYAALCPFIHHRLWYNCWLYMLAVLRKTPGIIMPVNTDVIAYPIGGLVPKFAPNGIASIAYPAANESAQHAFKPCLGHLQVFETPWYLLSGCQSCRAVRGRLYVYTLPMTGAFTTCSRPGLELFIHAIYGCLHKKRGNLTQSNS